PLRSRDVEHSPTRSDRRGEQRYVVAERLPKPARLEEIALHVDDDERGALPDDRDRFWIGVDQEGLHAPGHSDVWWSVVGSQNPYHALGYAGGQRMMCDFNGLRVLSRRRFPKKADMTRIASVRRVRGWCNPATDRDFSRFAGFKWVNSLERRCWRFQSRTG